MRVDVLGSVTVREGDSALSGAALGGRRARIALVALALAERSSGGVPHAVPAERLAALIWADSPPPTWQTALRGIVSAIRSACALIGGEGQALIETVPDGYRLGRDVSVDVIAGSAAVRAAAELLHEGRLQPAVDAAADAARLRGAHLLPAEDAEWLASARAEIDDVALRALLVVSDAAGLLGDRAGSTTAARDAVALAALDERTHRALITALDRAGDRAGAVRAYESCRELLADQLGVDPSQQTVDAYLSAIRDQPAAAGARVPVPTTSFVARDQERALLADALARPGVVTITGHGGVGKSRLAAHAAADRAAFPGGRYWVSTAGVADESLLASGVALVLGVPVGVADPGQAVADFLAPLGRALLVLDGAETVIDGVASFVATLLDRAPLLTVLVTSRLPVSLEGELVITLSPLPAPDASSTAALAASPQIRLLLDRVREAGGALALDEDLVPSLASLCERCAGLPLALELVAAQLTALPPGDLLDHLDLESANDGLVGLRSVARSTYALLDTDEATVFRRLGVLDGPSGLAFIRQVVADDQVAAIRVVRIVRELTARGLLGVDRSGPHWRYQLDDDLHAFARELLDEGGESTAAYGRLADAIRSRLPEDARAAPGPFAADVTDVLSSVRSLFAAALAGRADLERCRELAFRLHRYFANTSVAEGRFWLGRLIAAGASTDSSPYAMYALGYLSYWAGDTDNAVPELESAVSHLETKPDAYLARALIFLAGLLDDLDRGAEAIACVRRSIEAAAPFEVDLQVSAAMGLGSVLGERGDPAAAGHARDAIALCRERGSAAHLSLALPTAAMVCWQAGALEQARAYAAEARPMHAETRQIARVVLLSVSAALSLAEHDVAGAIEFGSAADALATDLGVEREVPLVRSVLARSLLAAGDLPAAAERALAAVEAGLTVSIGHPLAGCLESAALVIDALGGAPADVGRLLGAARDLRAAGDRPTPPTLVGDLDRLRARLAAAADVASDVTAPDVIATDPVEAAALARSLLSVPHVHESSRSR